MVDKNDLFDRLPRQSILAALGEAEGRRILSIAASRRFLKGEVLMDTGEEGDSLMVILSGMTKVSVVSPAGREMTLDYVGPGGLIGELSVLDGASRSARVTAVEPVEAMVVYRRDVIPYLERNGSAALAVIRALCGRLRRTNALVETTTTLGLEPKLALGLLRLLPQGETTIHLSQGEIASAVALSRENVNRQLREWQDMGYVELARGRLYIRDPATLQEIADLAD